MLSESLALLPIPDNGWLLPEDAERWLRERAASYTMLLMEGFHGAARADADPWGLLAMDVAVYTEVAARAVFEGRQVRLARDESDRVAVGHLSDLVSLYGQWLQSDEAGCETAAAAYDELCQALRALRERTRPAAPLEAPAEASMDAAPAAEDGDAHA